MATHSSILTWRTPGTAEPDGLPSMGSHRVGHDRSDLAAVTTTVKKQNKTKQNKILMDFWRVNLMYKFIFELIPCLLYQDTDLKKKKTQFPFYPYLIYHNSVI